MRNNHKKSTKKLTRSSLALEKETLRNLSSDIGTEVAGGATGSDICEFHSDCCYTIK